MGYREVSDVTQAFRRPRPQTLSASSAWVRANGGSVFVTVTATMGIHVGVFTATGERQWLILPRENHGLLARQTPQAIKANPPAHSTVSHSQFVVEMGLGIGVSRLGIGALQNGETRTRVPRRHRGLPQSWSHTRNGSIALPVPSPMPCPLTGHPSCVSLPQLAKPCSACKTPLWSPVFPETCPTGPSFNSGMNVSYVLPGFMDFHSHHKYLLSTYHAPSPALETAVSKTGKVPVF